MVSSSVFFVSSYILVLTVKISKYFTCQDFDIFCIDMGYFTNSKPPDNMSARKGLTAERVIRQVLFLVCLKGIANT